MIQRTSLIAALLVIVSVVACLAPQAVSAVTEQPLQLTLAETVRLAKQQNLDWLISQKELERQKFNTELSRDLSDHLEFNDSRLELRLRTESALREQIAAVEQVIADLDEQIAATVDPVLLLQLQQQKATQEDALSDLQTSLVASEGGVEQQLGALVQLGAVSNQQISALMGLKTDRDLGTSELIELLGRLNRHATLTLRETDSASVSQFTLLVEQKYYDQLQAAQVLAAREKALEAAEEQCRVLELCYQEGLVARAELLQGQTQRNNVQMQVDAARMALDNVKLDLATIIGVSFDQTIELMPIEIVRQELPELTEAIKSGLAQRGDVKQADRQLEIAELNMELTEDNYRSSTDQYRESMLYLEKTELETERAELKAEGEIRKALAALQLAEATLLNMRGLRDFAEQQATIATAMFSEGMSQQGTLASMLSTQSQLLTVEENLIKTEFSYALAWRNFLYVIGSYEAKTNEVVTQ